MWRANPNRSLLVLYLIASLAGICGAESSTRGLKICVAANAPADVHHAAESILAAVPTHSLLSVMAGSQGVPKGLTDTTDLLAAKPGARAFDHLVIVGLLDDPLVRAAWQREAEAEDGGLYVFGIGHLSGDIGYVESNRNPFLHSRFIPRAPYETEVISITGTTPAGVALATDAFLKHGLINGTIGGLGWKRTRIGLLDHDPLAPDFSLPDWVPAQAGEAREIGASQAGEDEYRGVLEDTGVEPKVIWRIKFYVPGAWDGAGSGSAFASYANGLHRRAYGNTLWCAEFQSAAQAGEAAPKIAFAAKLKPVTDAWHGSQPPYGPEKESAGPLSLWRHDRWVVMSTLPENVTHALQGKTR